MTLESRPPQITEDHLRRKAVVYIRQSSEEQVRYSQGSTALQRDLAAVLQNWGWPQDSIEIIDGDLGVSAARPGLRRDFDALIEDMKKDQVGIVAVVNFARVGRNHAELFTFGTTAREHDVLLLHGSQITDFRDANSEFTAFVLGLNAARENRERAEYSRRARRKKAEAGIAFTRPPAGYLAERGGTWQKDPDQRVRQVIQLVFDKFHELGSCGSVHRYLMNHGVQLPRRHDRGTLAWAPPTRVRIHRLLRNPAYAGIYVYGATRTDDGRHMQVAAGDRLYFKDHHEPYVAPHRWEEIQHRLGANRRTVRAPLGRGDALLQGLLRCARHNRAFGTFYPARERRNGMVIRRALYRCFDTDAPSGHKFCAVARARTLDHVVERELFRVLNAPAADVIEEIHREACHEHDALARLRESKEREAEQRAAEAERAHQQADPKRPLVKERLAAQWEEALRKLKDIQTEHHLHPLGPPRTLTEADRFELHQLLADLPGLWRDPRVQPEHRKAVARAVISTIHVTPDSNAWKIDIEWVGGERSSLDFLTSRGVQTIVEQAVTDGRTAAEIARLLAERGAIQRAGPHIGTPYTAQSVKVLIRRLGWERSFKHQAYEYLRARYLERISLRQIASELNAHHLRHPHGDWTEHRVQGAVYRLRTQAVAGVPALPSIEPLSEKVIALHHTGLSAKEIAAKLSEEGLLTMQRRRPTPNTIGQILRRQSPARQSRIARRRRQRSGETK